MTSNFSTDQSSGAFRTLYEIQLLDKYRNVVVNKSVKACNCEFISSLLMSNYEAVRKRPSDMIISW